jgi:hypothetical protein
MGSVLKLVLAVGLFLVVLRAGLWSLRLIARPAPPPPPPGELRKVDVRYRCSVCGLETRVTRAADEDPEPPRHCMEEMDLTAAPYE